MNNNFWPDFSSEGVNEINDTLEILKEQAKNIQKSTSNAVKGAFSKVDYQLPEGLSALGEQLTLATKGLDKFSKQEVLTEVLVGKKDLNVLNEESKARYRFEIYNSTYRYRLFFFEYQSFFPVYIELEEGIRMELSYPEKKEILSNEELIENLKYIFGSKKVREVVSCLMEKNNISIQKQIVEIIREKPSITLAEMAGRLSISQITLKKYLKNMKERKIINYQSGKLFNQFEIIENK